MSTENSVGLPGSLPRQAEAPGGRGPAAGGCGWVSVCRGQARRGSAASMAAHHPHPSGEHTLRGGEPIPGEGRLLRAGHAQRPGEGQWRGLPPGRSRWAQSLRESAGTWGLSLPFPPLRSMPAGLWGLRVCREHCGVQRAAASGPHRATAERICRWPRSHPEPGLCAALEWLPALR